jgi:hypothetical protein
MNPAHPVTKTLDITEIYPSLIGHGTGEWLLTALARLDFTCSAYYQSTPGMRRIAGASNLLPMSLFSWKSRSSLSPLLSPAWLPKALRENAELSYASNFTVVFLT